MPEFCRRFFVDGPLRLRLGSRAELRRCRAWVHIAAATLSGNSLRQTVHTHRVSVHQAAKVIAALLRITRVTTGLAESDGSLPPRLWLTSPAGWLTARTRISCWTQSSVGFLPYDFKGEHEFTLKLTGIQYNSIRYDRMRDAILTSARKPTWVSLIYRTETTTKKCKTENLKSKNGYAQK